MEKPRTKKKKREREKQAPLEGHLLPGGPLTFERRFIKSKFFFYFKPLYLNHFLTNHLHIFSTELFYLSATLPYMRFFFLSELS